VPTVIYKTKTIPCPSATSAPAAWTTMPSNSTTSPTSVPAPVVAGAASLSSSLLVAAAAGLVAVFFA
jgi:hypothetical protein